MDIIARIELLACVVGILCFDDMIKHKIVRLHTDNDNAYHWLRKSRVSNLLGTRLLAVWEYGKYRTESKVSPV